MTYNNARRNLVLAIISAYHTTRLAESDLATFLLDNYNVQQALKELQNSWQSQ